MKNTCFLAVLLAACPVWAAAEREMIDADWRKQDGIGTPRQASTFQAAVERLMERGSALTTELRSSGSLSEELGKQWEEARREQQKLTDAKADEAAWEKLWLSAHELRRKIVFSNPLFKTGPLLFIKQIPGSFSHQLTQVYGRYARPGGGVFVLEEPGESFKTRALTQSFGEGSFQTPEVSYDGREILFAYCSTTEKQVEKRFYHVYRMNVDGTIAPSPLTPLPPARRPAPLVEGDRSGGRDARTTAGTEAGRQQEAGGGRQEAGGTTETARSSGRDARTTAGAEAGATAAGKDARTTAGTEAGATRQLTDGAYDDFSAKFLPSGEIVFISTRRGGFHRCGSPGCPVYTLAAMNGDGSGIRMLSHHEVQEWDPAVLPDGRLIYTRWDYVDRHAVFGQQLWTCRPDGTAPLGYYGNYTLNPVGIWEAQPVPNSRLVMATAAAHHAMTAGSIVLVDVLKGYDGLEPLTRLTPETPFPESEFAVAKKWFFKARDGKPTDTPENLRWPGHCYKSPRPLSEKYFIAAYSFDQLIGEPSANIPNMFGLYAVDAFGNKELLYRDPEISSLWAMPLRARPKPPALPSPLEAQNEEKLPVGEGLFVVQNVYSGRTDWPAGLVKRLRVVQVLPKSTSGKDNPPVGAAAGAPGKAVLGTVPVEADGSAYFRAPANVPVLFQALDESGQALQVMRSATYLQAGERQQCIGCHEPRQITPEGSKKVAALERAPSQIEPGPDGSKPFSYPILVQGILDKHCVRCHDGKHPEAKVSLTGEPQGKYTVSYNVLVKTVPYASDTEIKPISRPGQYGAKGSSAMKLLLDAKGHYEVKLSREEIERVATWMDTNALFYGTFEPAEQLKQQKGERIALPTLQ
ncbi:MAG TPA: hypothetical protein VGP72_13590 [Planctomycetota bacterium]|jgi:hypothetical protein